MFKILIILSAGIVLGVLFKEKELIIKSSERLANISIYFLLFFLGVSVGINEEIFNNLASIGILSLVITVFAVAGSLLTAYLLSKYILKIKNEE